MWAYLKFDEFGERTDDSPKLPGKQTVYLGFDVCRMALVIGYTERGGYNLINTKEKELRWNAANAEVLLRGAARSVP